MPVYRVNLSDGRQFEVESPTPLTPEQAQQHVLGQQEQPKGSLLGTALDVATGIGSFIPHPAISIPSRAIQAGLGIKKASEGDLLGAAFGGFAATKGLGLLGRAGKAINTAPEAAQTVRGLTPATQLGDEVGGLAKSVAAGLKQPTDLAPNLVRAGARSGGLRPVSTPQDLTRASRNVAQDLQRFGLGTAQTPNLVRGGSRIPPQTPSAPPGGQISTAPRAQAPLAQPVPETAGFAAQARASLDAIKRGEDTTKVVGSAANLTKDRKARQIVNNFLNGKGPGGTLDNLKEELGFAGMTLDDALPRLPDGLRQPLQAFLNPGERGVSGLQVMTALAGGGIGALTGATQGETAQDRAANAILFGGLGAVTGGLAPRAIQAFLSQTAREPTLGAIKAAIDDVAPTMKGFSKAKAKNALDVVRFNAMLSKPTTIGKIAGGTNASVIAIAGELMAQGQTPKALHLLKAQLGNIRNIPDAIRNPAKYQPFFPGGELGMGTKAFEEATLQNPGGVKGFLTLPGRIARAIDAVTMKSAADAGLTADEIGHLRTFMFTGPPTSRAGRKAMEFFHSSYATQLAVPFPRVAIQSLERGLEFSPLGLLGSARGGAGVPQLNQAQRLFRAGAGTAAMGAGAAGGASGEFSKRDAFVGSALTGPAALPTLIGFVLGEAFAAGKLDSRALDDVINQLSFEMPLPDVNAIERLVRGEQFVPGILETVATTLDPVPRGTQGFFDPVKRKIPGLRESLPPDFRFGR